ncbi:MAG: hypothetical protein GPJ52_05965 [Candidatus Heimdallarchaeota archaeon]|nr:hypothetical protein [Candidatus Heimdallarchaeota archaeon]
MSDEISKLESNSTAGIDENSDEILEKNESEEVSEEKKPKQKKLFWLISTGSNSSDLILLNFFQYFAELQFAIYRKHFFKSFLVGSVIREEEKYFLL